MNALAAFTSSDGFVALLASTAVKGSLLLVAGLLLDLVLRRHAAALRHRVWTAAFAALLLVPLAVPLAPDWSLPLLPAIVSFDAHLKEHIHGSNYGCRVGKNISLSSQRRGLVRLSQKLILASAPRNARG